ncbi:MAG: FAD-binding protein [Alphaproteobacteria bacterium]|jgi:glycolate oxidase FAD binding subunit|nr:FAD-binding protein [Alphaproteobacteria bacterium]
MTTRLKPDNADQVVDAVKWAASEGVPLELVGGGSMRTLGRPLQTEHVLDISGLSGVLLYEPEELVVSALPGTPIAELEAVLAEKGQHLAFEPPDLSALLGAADAPGGNRRGTLGGVVACNLAGPRRIHAGAVRDHVLGLSGVSGRGDAYKTGGRVFKNVTGYDLSKLMTGSYGTLSALTQITVKALPRPETVRTLLLHGLGDADGIAALTAALQTPYEVSGAAHLPAAAARRSAVPDVSGAGGAVTAIRLEGIAASVFYRLEHLPARLGPAAANGVTELGFPASDRFWREVRDVASLIPADTLVWRLSVPPAAGPAVVAALDDLDPAGSLFDWGGGLVWLALAPGAKEDGGAAAIRAAVKSTAGEGHATLIRAPGSLRAGVPVFQPQPPELAALTGRIKQSFDPQRALNPGRLYADI